MSNTVPNNSESHLPRHSAAEPQDDFLEKSTPTPSPVQRQSKPEQGLRSKPRMSLSTEWATIWISVIVLVSGVAQYFGTYNQQEKTSENQAVVTREQVLTDYSESVSNLMAGSKESGRDSLNEIEKNIIRGKTFVALRRLNVGNEIEQANVEADSQKNFLSKLPGFRRNGGDQEKKRENLSKLKGLLIRYLYDVDLVKSGDNLIDLSGANIDNVVLEDAPLDEISLSRAWLRNSNLKNAILFRADLKGAVLEKTDLTRADLKQAKLFGANLTSANLDGADLTGATLIKANLFKANLFDTNVDSERVTRLTNTDLRYSDLRFVQLDPERLASAKLAGACYVKVRNLEKTYGFTKEFADKNGMKAIPEKNSNPEKPDEFEPCPWLNLANQDLTGQDLSGIDLSGVNLSGANLAGADLTRTNLTGADLRYANLTNVNLDDVNLSRACYVDGPEVNYRFDQEIAEKKGMVSIPSENSNDEEDNYQTCE